MNHGSFNQISINGSLGDTTVRIVTSAIAVAYVTAGGWVKRRNEAITEATASITGIGGRVYYFSKVDVVIESTVTYIARSYRRFISLLDSSATVVLTAKKWAREPITLGLLGSVVNTARKYARDVVGSSASASASGLTTVYTRSPVSTQAEASITNNAKFISYTYVTSPVSVVGSALTSASSVLYRREALGATATASVTAAGRRSVREAVTPNAVAQIYLSVGVTYKQIPYDEPATADNTFVVPFVETTFIVS